MQNTQWYAIPLTTAEPAVATTMSVSAPTTSPRNVDLEKDINIVLRWAYDERIMLTRQQAIDLLHIAGYRDDAYAQSQAFAWRRVWDKLDASVPEMHELGVATGIERALYALDILIAGHNAAQQEETPVTTPEPLPPPSGPIGSNSGHGYAWDRPDGQLAKCMGPGECPQCDADAETVEALLVMLPNWTKGY